MVARNSLLEKVENTAKSPLRPQMVIRALSDALADNAVISLDCGANTHFAALPPPAGQPRPVRGQIECLSNLPRWFSVSGLPPLAPRAFAGADQVSGPQNVRSTAAKSAATPTSSLT
jgi:hypothetical protein